MIYVSIDIETCGLDWNEDSVLEFGAVLEDTKSKIPLDLLPKFSRILEQEKYIGSPYALSLHKEIFDELAKKKSERTEKIIPNNQLGKEFRNWLIDWGFEHKITEPLMINVAGKNFGTFDMRFLERIPGFKENVWFNHRIIDPGVLFYENDIDDELPNLMKCKQRAGLKDLKIAHRTIADALDVINVLRYKLY